MRPPFEGLGAGPAQQTVELRPDPPQARRPSGPHHHAARRPGAWRGLGLSPQGGAGSAVPVAASRPVSLTEAPAGRR